MTDEEVIERLRKNKEKSITLQEWLDSYSVKNNKNQISPEEWEEAVAWVQSLKNHKPLD